jgi:hypothetical protein
MMYGPLKNRVLASTIALPILFSIGIAAAQPVKLKEILEKIVIARTGDTLDARADAAENLVILLEHTNPESIDHTTLSQLTSLLDSPDDSVRLYVAGALGFLGPRAKAAIPKLIEALPKSECLRGDITSAAAIRTALTRIGAQQPPPTKCDDAHN